MINKKKTSEQIRQQVIDEIIYWLKENGHTNVSYQIGAVFKKFPKGLR
jgi:hypothetical protein